MLNALNTDNSPFDERQLQALKASIGALDPAQSQWLSGYLAGRLVETAAPAAAPRAEPSAGQVLTILYGSETGNGEALAERLAATAGEAGLAAEVVSLDGFRPAQLRKLRHAVFIMSTHGEGDPPEEAVDLFEFLDSERAPRLEKLRYRVLALGDRSYELFCEAGRRLDERLAALGAQAFGQRVDCDVDYGPGYEAWASEVIGWSHDHLASQAPAPAAHLSVVRSSPAWSREQPFLAEAGRVQKITGLESAKDVYHLELSLEGSGIRYEPGDALGVWAPNDDEAVAQLLQLTGNEKGTPVQWDGREMPLQKALSEHLEVTRLTADTVQAYARAAGQRDLAGHFEALESKDRRSFIEQRQFIDLVEAYPGPLEAQALVDLLRPLSPRSYSIASSQALVDEEVHLTVATLHSNAIGVDRTGVASQFLNHRLGVGGRLRVFPEHNRRFRLPGDPATPIIMIGAGTGIAPYRAFLQQLEATGASPDAWLIFGNPHLRTDFLYQREFLAWRERGLLRRIDGAWSRDQEDKRYVQHVVLEQAQRVERWLQRGAQVFICGGLDMGQAVSDALARALAAERGLDAEGASAALAELRRQRRLHKDLY